MLSACLMTLVVVACAAAPPPTPTSNPIDGQAAALGINLRSDAWPADIVPGVVVFARVEEGVDLTEAYELYESTYAYDGHLYLMNAEPGTYVAVATVNTKWVELGTTNEAGEEARTKKTRLCYLSRDLIEQTRVTVRPGEFAFMGRIVGDQSGRFGDGDDCQRHFMTLMEGEEDRSGFMKALSGESSGRIDLKELDKSPAARREFLTETRGYFATTAWVALIDAELAQIPVDGP